MKYRINRKTGDRISEIGIGSSYMFCAGMAEAIRALRCAVEGGINYFDLAAGDGKIPHVHLQEKGIKIARTLSKRLAM